MSDSGGIPEIQYNHPDGNRRSRVEMDQWLREKLPKVHWLRIIASRTFGLPKQVSWDMREIVLRHWLLDELVRRQLIEGDQLGVNATTSNDENELRQFTQRLAAFIQMGQAVQPQHAEGVDMNGYTPPPPPVMGGAPQQQPNGQPAAYPPGPPQPPGPPPGVPQMAGPPQGYPQPPQPPGPPQQYAQPPQAPPPGPPMGPPGYAPPPGVPAGPPQQYAAPQPPAPMGPPAGPPQGAPAPSGGGRGGRRKAAGEAQAAPPAAPVPPMQQQQIPFAPQGYAPPAGPPQGFTPPQTPVAPPQQFAAPAPMQQQPAPGIDLTATNQKLDQLLSLVSQQATKIANLERQLQLNSMATALVLRGVYQKAGSADIAAALTEIGVQLPQ